MFRTPPVGMSDIDRIAFLRAYISTCKWAIRESDDFAWQEWGFEALACLKEFRLAFAEVPPGTDPSVVEALYPRCRMAIIELMMLEMPGEREMCSGPH